MLKRALLLLLVACRAPAPASNPQTTPVEANATATADRLKNDSELPLGANATAKVGDYRLSNADAVFVIDSLDGKQGFAASGGNLIDAHLRPSGVDALNQTFLYLDETFPRQAYWKTITLDPPGKDGSASITVSGEDTNDPAIAVRTTYRLGAHGPLLTIITTVENTSTLPLDKYELGDCLQWGKTEHFAPGAGYEMSGKKLDLAWVAGIGDGVSYGILSKDPKMHAFSGSSWTDVVHKVASLQPKESMRFERYLVVGIGDVTSILDNYANYAPEGAPKLTLGTLQGVVSQTNGEAVELGELTFFKDATPFATTKCLSGGYYEAKLPIGEYWVEISGSGLRSKTRKKVVITALPQQKAFSVESGGPLTYAITENGAPVPAKLSVYGTNGTPNPVFGKTFEAKGALNVSLSADGRGLVKLPPGSYKVYASRGFEYDLAEADIVVVSNQANEVKLDIHRVLDTRGYMSADFHQHQRNSFDSAMTLEDRAITNLAEGVEIIVPTDHDFVTDYKPVLERMGLQSALKTMSGVEATTNTLGHFAAYPMTPRPGSPRNGAPETWNKKVKDIVSDLRADANDKVIQINHPRDEMTGYFNAQHLNAESGDSADPDFEWDFDAVEVLNGKRIKDADKVLADWMHLITNGKRVTLTGNSDTHNVVFNEVGYPRNFLRIPDDGFSPQAVVDAVKKRRAVIVTNGPFIELFAGEASAPAQVGDTLSVKAGEQTLRFKLQAAPWVDVTSFELWQDGQKIHTQAIAPSKAIVRLEGTRKITVTKDSYVLAVVRGDKALEPVLPTFRNKPSKPFAITNPIYFTLKKK